MLLSGVGSEARVSEGTTSTTAPRKQTLQNPARRSGNPAYTVCLKYTGNSIQDALFQQEVSCDGLNALKFNTLMTREVDISLMAGMLISVLCQTDYWIKASFKPIINFTILL